MSRFSRLLSLLVVLCVLAVGCGDDATTAGPGSTSTTTPTTTSAKPPDGPLPSIVGGGTSFGECVGLCVSELVIEGDAVTLERRSWDRGERAGGTGELTSEGRDQLAAVERGLVGVVLEATYGCPDCADGGATWIDMVVDVEDTRSTYETSVAPDPLTAWDAWLMEVSAALASCTSGPLVEVAGECVTEPDGGSFEIVGGGFSFGMCLGYCVTDLEIAGKAVVLTRSAWDVIEDDPLDPEVFEGSLTEAGATELGRLARGLAGAVLQETYGCPDCADGGSGWVMVRDATGQRQSTFPYFEAPPELAPTDEFLRGLIDTLRSCAADMYVTSDDGCVPSRDAN